MTSSRPRKTAGIPAMPAHAAPLRVLAAWAAAGTGPPPRLNAGLQSPLDDFETVYLPASCRRAYASLTSPATAEIRGSLAWTASERRCGQPSKGPRHWYFSVIRRWRLQRHPDRHMGMAPSGDRPRSPTSLRQRPCLGSAECARLGPFNDRAFALHEHQGSEGEARRRCRTICPRLYPFPT